MSIRRFSYFLTCSALFSVSLWAQTPVVLARGVVNGVTFELAPSTVAPGGIFNIYGFNLAGGTVSAGAIPLPTALGTDGVQVLVDGKPAPLYFVSPTQINAQVPWETPAGPAQVVATRKGASSQATTLTIRAAVPSIFALNGAGFGPAIAVRANGQLVSPSNPPAADDVLVLYASGLGPVSPAVASGAAGPSGPLSGAARLQRAFVAGFPAAVQFAGLAPGFVGLFQVNLQLPDQALPGDVLQYFSDQQMANLVTLGATGAPRVKFLPLPNGFGTLGSITDTALNGNFVAVNGPPDSSGCYQNVYLLDFRRNQTTQITDCLISSNANLPSPFVTEANTGKLAALVGPAVGQAPAGISSTVAIWDAGTGAKTTVTLPAAASSLLGGGGGGIGGGVAFAGGGGGAGAGAAGRGLLAIIPGSPAQLAIIDTDTGQVQLTAGGILTTGGGGAGSSLSVDGLSSIVSTPVSVGSGRTAVVIADSATAPQNAEFVVLSTGANVASKIPFPSGYVPLIPPAAQATGGSGGGGSGGSFGGGGFGGGAGTGGIAATPRESTIDDAAGNRVLALARSSDGLKHALIVFNLAAGSAQAMDFPSGVYAATCAPALRMFDLALGQKVALPITDRVETAATAPCASTGLLLFDLNASTLRQAPLPGSGTLDVNSLRSVNDYLYGSNADRVSQQNATSVYIYDPVNDSIRQIDTPSGSTSFTSLTAVAATGQLLAFSTNRAAGDEGLILFDLSSSSTTPARLFPVPDGFARVSDPALQMATRNLTARGVKPDGSAQFLVFNPATGAVTVAPNPGSVQSLGAAAGESAGTPNRVIWQRNDNANTVLAPAYDSNNNLIGLVLAEGS